MAAFSDPVQSQSNSMFFYVKKIPSAQKKRFILGQIGTEREISNSLIFDDLRLVKGNDISKREKIHGGVVHLNALLKSDVSDSPKLVRVCVSTDELAKCLGKTSKEIQSAVKNKALGTLIKYKIDSDNPQVESSEANEAQTFIVSKQYGVSREELDSLREKIKSINFDADLGTFISRRNKELNLSKSIVNIPNGPFSGTYILLKEAELGKGRFNRTTLAMNITTGELKVWRTARNEDVKAKERRFNQDLIKDSLGIVVGTPVNYKGNWKDRRGGGSKIRGIEKIGYITDYLPGGTLADKIADKSLTIQQKIQIAIRLAQILGKEIHQKMIVHFDIKPDNLYLDLAGTLFIADLGLADSVGAKHHRRGTPGYTAPEVHNALPGIMAECFVADPKNDIWSVGCVLVELFGPKGWIKDFKELSLSLGSELEQRKKKEIDQITNKHFKNTKEGTLEYNIEQLIKRCLQFDPAERPTALELASMLKSILLFTRPEFTHS